VLQASDDVLWHAYDLAMLDLDGVVYVGPQAVPGAAQHLARARDAGMTLAFVTNNASRTPGDVAAHLRELGVEAVDDDVVTSAQAAARLLRERLPDGSAVFVIGGRGLEVALAERGLRPVRDRDAGPVAVVSGFARDVSWGRVMDGAMLVRDGLPWVASNTDLTVPTPHGPGPGNGMLVGVVARFSERTPDVAGKPEPPLFAETLRRVGGRRPLVVGDRIDTDIEGARRGGYDSLLVMTGVTGAAELAEVPPRLRPSYVGADLGALAVRHDAPVVARPGSVDVAGWTATVRDGVVRLRGEGDRHAWWQALAVAAWQHLDTAGSPVDVSQVVAPGTVAAEDGPVDRKRGEA